MEASDRAQTGAADRDQEASAVAEHSRTADLFAERYVKFDEDPYQNTFTYSRLRLDALMSSRLPSDGAGLRLLDVGCGTGHQLREMQERGFEIAGTDGSEEMLEHARTLNPGAELRQSGVDQLPYEDATFDYAICLEVLRYLPNPEPCLRELRRVLRPAGTALITATPLLNLNLYALVNQLAMVLPGDSLTRLKQFFTTSRKLHSQLLAAGFRGAEVHGVYLGPVNWVQRLAPARTPALLKRWEPVDARLADLPGAREFANMFLVVARA